MPALNAAGVWKTPTVFFCQNNLYAQSTPAERTNGVRDPGAKSAGLWIRGCTRRRYGCACGVRAVKAAVDKARSGGGPTLIESLCYRYSAHSTYDGTPVYRTRDEEGEWLDRDPLIRMRSFLDSRGLSAGEIEAEEKERTKKAVSAAIDQLENTRFPRATRYFARWQ